MSDHPAPHIVVGQQISGEPGTETPTLERELRMPEYGILSKAFEKSKKTATFTFVSRNLCQSVMAEMMPS